MTFFPNSPCLLKDAWVGTDPRKLLVSTAAFKYDHNTLTDMLQVQDGK